MTQADNVSLPPQNNAAIARPRWNYAASVASQRSHEKRLKVQGDWDELISTTFS